MMLYATTRLPRWSMTQVASECSPGWSMRCRSCTTPQSRLAAFRAARSPVATFYVSTASTARLKKMPL